MADFSKLLKYGSKAAETVSEHPDVEAKMSRLLDAGVPYDEALKQVILTNPKASPVSSYVSKETNLGPRGEKSFEMVPDKDFTMPENPGLPDARKTGYIDQFSPEVDAGMRDVTPYKESVITPEYRHPELAYSPKEVPTPDMSSPLADSTQVSANPEWSSQYPGLSKAMLYAGKNPLKVGASGVAGAGILSSLLGGDTQSYQNSPVDPLMKRLQAQPQQPQENIPPEAKTNSNGGSNNVGSSGGSPSSGSSSMKPITINANDFQTVGSQDALNQALKQQKDINTMALAGKIGQGLGAAIAKVPTGDTSNWDNIQKMSDQPVKDYQSKLENEKNDPESGISKLYKETLKGMGIDLKGNPSAAALEKQIPGIEKILTFRENAAARKDMANASAQEMSMRREEMGKFKEDKETVKRFDDLNKRLVSETASGRSVFGRAANVVRASQAVENLVNQYGNNFDKLDNRQIMELAKSLDSILSQGSATVTGTSKLIPKSLWGDVKGIAEFITNTRQGAGQGSFVDTMVHTVQREKELAQQQIKGAQKKILGSYGDLEQKDPEKFDTLMKVHGLRTDDDNSGTPEINTTPSNKNNVVQPPHGLEVNQNGHIYRWNPSTQKYEEKK